MNSPLELTRNGTRWAIVSDEDRPLSADELIEDYLDHLCAPLIGVVPYRERAELREEAAYTVERLSNALALQGLDSVEATRCAIEKHGESQEVGSAFLESWFRNRPQGWLSRQIGPANVAALTYFSFATFCATVLVQLKICFPRSEPISFFGLTPAQMRHLIPEPLPLPEGGMLTWVLLIFTLIAPFAAGWQTGRTVPVRPARAVWRTLTLLTLYSFVVGAQMLPMREGIMLALFQLFFWLPVGCLMANLSAALSWQRRCRFQPRPV